MGKHQQKWDGGCVVVPSFFLGDKWVTLKGLNGE